MWPRKKLNEDGGAIYAVLLHAKDLIITDDQGAECAGGAYTWRFVTAPNRTEAVRKAIESLLETPAFVEEVRNLDQALSNVSVDEIVALDRPDDSRGTGVVFYIDTNERM